MKRQKSSRGWALAYLLATSVHRCTNTSFLPGAYRANPIDTSCRKAASRSPFTVLNSPADGDPLQKRQDFLATELARQLAAETQIIRHPAAVAGSQRRFHQSQTEDCLLCPHSRAAEATSSAWQRFAYIFCFPYPILDFTKEIFTRRAFQRRFYRLY